MTTTRVRHFGEVPQTAVAGTFNTGDATMSIASATGWPAAYPIDIVISRGNGALRERCRVGGLVGTTMTGVLRARDGTTAKKHDVGETVEICLSAENLDELNSLLGGAAGDINYFDASANAAKLPIAPANQILYSTGAFPRYSPLTTLVDSLGGGSVDGRVLHREGGNWVAAPVTTMLDSVSGGGNDGRVLHRESGSWVASYQGSLPVFANAAARDAAIPSPIAGQVCYLDTNDYTEGTYAYSGSAWYRTASRIDSRNVAYLGAVYDATKPIDIFTSRFTATTDSNGLFTLTLSAFAMPRLPVAIIGSHIQAYPTSAYVYCQLFIIADTSGPTTLNCRAFNVAGANPGVVNVQGGITLLYQ